MVEPEKSLLKRFNLIPFKLVLTADGPQYWVKSKAATALCHSEKTYYTSAFEDLLIGAVLFQQGQLGPVIDLCYARWAGDKNTLPNLMSSRQSNVIRELAHRVFTRTDGKV